jgi:phenylalanyl-tRNA synthetase alpha chain
MRQEIEALASRAASEIAVAPAEKDLEALRVRYLGKKGELTAFFKRLGELSKDERPAVGAILNEARERIEGELAPAVERARHASVEERLLAERLDVTLPGRPMPPGRKHILTQVAERITEIFVSMGFSVAEGPEIEDDYHNFEALNIPPDHPARAMQDTFYVEGGHLLRTHTSPVQIRVMEKQAPPVRIICPGAAYRNDMADASHSPMFHQVEGLMVDEGITLGDLKGVLDLFCRRMFGEDRGTRFRASFFPFTEPSAEVDVLCVCGGKGCPVCKQTGWLEIAGSGMVDPAVFGFVNVDAEKYTGFAFGMGIERIAMLRYGIDDIRLFYENDLRFLAQF